MKRAQVFEFFRRLAEANPSPTTELEYTQRLSAAGRGGAVGPGHRRQRQPRHAGRCSRASRPRGRCSRWAKTRCATRSRRSACSTPRRRTSSPCRKALIDQHGGEVPRTREALQALPGVGRKTANVVLNTAFGEETFAVDTHVFRVCNRTGLAPGKTVDEVEAKLEKSCRSRSAATRTTG